MVGCPDNLREPGGRSHQGDKVRCLPSMSTCQQTTLRPFPLARNMENLSEVWEKSYFQLRRLKLSLRPYSNNS